MTNAFRVDMNWRDNSQDEIAFVLERSANGGAFQAVKTLDAGTTSTFELGLQPASQYSWRVRAQFDSSESEPSREWQLRSLPAPARNGWQMIGSDAAHTGQNLAETGQPPLTPIWVWQNPFPLVPRATVMNRERIAVHFGSANLFMLHAATGTYEWGWDVVAASLGYEMSDTRIVIQAPSPTGRIFAFDPAGFINHEWAAYMDSQWDEVWGPIRVNGTIYGNVGLFGGIGAYDDATGAAVFARTLPEFDAWSPAWSGTEVLSWVHTTLRGHDAQTGLELWSTVVRPPSEVSGSMATLPAVCGDRAFVVDRPGIPMASATLHAISLVTHQVIWSQPIGSSPIPSWPGCSGGLVFVLANGALEAREEATGSLSWTFAGDGQLSGGPAITVGFLYVGGDGHSYAVDLATHQSVWTGPAGLPIVGNGMVIITGPNTVSAFALTQ